MMFGDVELVGGEVVVGEDIGVFGYAYLVDVQR
jgi:hypothetical protein